MGKLIRQVTVVRDSMHNGFTDLQFWQGAYWVGYRKGAGHISMDAHAVVAVSHDRTRFTEIGKSRMPGDVRDPKLLPIDESRMAMYYPSWTEGAGTVERDGQTWYKPIQQYITFSANGMDWEPAKAILGPNQWLWRVHRHDGRFYGLVQNLAGPRVGDRPCHQLDLAVSDDLLNWEVIGRVGDGLNESDIHWRPNGEAWIVSRSIDKEIGSVFARAQAPYTTWETVDMTTMVHSPIFLEHAGELYVAGRSKATSEGIMDAPFNGSSLSVWRVTPGQLESVLRIPASGDCAYPGLIKDPAGRICMSYYSQHAYNLGVIRRHEREADAGTEADVYFAELDL